MYSQAFFAQSDKNELIYVIPEEYSSIHHEGERALLMKKYGEALRLFKKVLKKYPDFPPALRSAGACYELMGDYEKATINYEAALESNPYFSRAMYYEIGNIHYKCGRYDIALQSFELFDSLLSVDIKQFTYNGFEERKIEQEYLGNLEASRRACHIALDSIQFWNIEGVYNLGTSINTKADEYFPYLSNSNKTIFYTSRRDKFSDENLFVSTCEDNVWKSGRKVNEFNTGKHEGMTTLVQDGRHFYFTACERENVKGTCDIWEGRLNGTEVYDLSPTEGANNSEAWESQASINCDGTILYFSSNREGGQGGTDIWKSHRLPDGNWGDPVNLGDHINTPYDEEAPYITNDGQTLFFSSTGHTGLGEQDIFFSKLAGDDFWSLPVNLGMPVNSSYRELGFFLSADGKTGFFASDRVGGAGGMDIYYFELPDVLQSNPVTLVEGQVKDSITLKPLPFTTVVIKDRQTLVTDEEGRFFLCVDANDYLDINVRRKEYHPYQREFRIPQWDNTTFYKLDILLDPLFKLPSYSDLNEPDPPKISKKIPPFSKKEKFTVYFDFDKSDMKSESIEDFKQFLVANFAEREPAYIEIIGFTDEQGDEAYNLELSEKRAEAVGVFLKEKNIKVDDIRLEGKGKNLGFEPDWKKRKVEIIVYLAE